ncbi:MAG: glutaredoxin 3 [Pseudomonadales bacterium]
MSEVNLMPDIKMYATRFCPYCMAARSLFDELKVPFSEIAVDGDRQLREEMTRLSGARTVPQIWVGDQHVGGFTELHSLHQNGGLTQLLSLN